jgi:phage terminase small subunit
VTPKQRRFVAEYLVDHNGAQAAIRAGYSPTRARQTAFVLLNDEDVREAVAAGDKAIEDQLVMSRIEVLRRLSAIARADIRKVVGPDGEPLLLNELDDETAAGLGGVEVEEIYEGRGEERRSIGRLHKFKTRDTIRALELLGKNHALWNDQPPPAPEGPGMTIVVQNGVQVDGQRVTSATRVSVNLPGPE